MAQFNHRLPDGSTLQVIDVETARKYLRRVVWSIMEGTPTKLIIGTSQRAQAVVLSPDAWLHDVNLQDQQARSGRRRGPGSGSTKSSRNGNRARTKNGAARELDRA